VNFYFYKLLFKENVIFFSLYNKDAIFNVCLNFQVLVVLRCCSVKCITRSFCDFIYFNSRNFI